jgi:uncharacterized protein YqcC (DUF446 family)
MEPVAGDNNRFSAVVRASVSARQPGNRPIGFRERESMQTEVAALLIDVEAQLRQLDLWEKIPPPAAALASQQPFCIDTLTLPQWLQFVFLPTMYEMLAQQQALPDRCSITPMAEEFFRGSGRAPGELLEVLLAIDELLSG